MNRIGACLALTVALVAGGVAAQSRPPLYKMVRSVALGGPDRWDYVVFDPPSGRVYVAHGDRISVVDGRDGRVLGEVGGIPGGAHGIGVSAATGQGYTDDGMAGQVVAFDLATLAVKARIAVDKDADAITFDPVSGHIFVIEGDPKKVVVIDPKTDTVIATIDGGGGLEYAAADGRGALFVAGEEKREVIKIDTRTNVVIAQWSIADCVSPHGVAIDAARHRVFLSCRNARLDEVDADTGGELASAPIGRGTDAAAFDPVRHRAFSSNGQDGTVSVIEEKQSGALAPVGEVATAVSGRTMSVNPRSGRLFIAAVDTDPSPTPGGRPHTRPGTLKLLFLDPAP